MRSDPAAEHIVPAVERTATGSLTAEEIQWILRIQASQEQLRRSTAWIEVQDHGAGPSVNGNGNGRRHGTAYAATVGSVAQRTRVDRLSSMLLFNLIRQFAPKRCVELGTALGGSAAYQGAALRLNGSGTLVTVEGAPSLASRAKQRLRELGLPEVDVVAGRFQDVLDNVIEEQRPIDFAFVDGHHDGPATVGYFDRIMQDASATAIVVFDDISWSPDMRRAWMHITDHPHVSLSVDLFRLGVCVVDRNGAGTRKYRLFSG